MATNYPTSLDVLSNPTGTDLLENAVSALDHDVQHSNANDAIEAIQAKVGINSSAVTTTHDYKLSGVTGSDKAVSLTGTEVLTNKTLTSPQINFGTNANGDIYYRNGSGVFSRLAIGSTDQILAVSSGLPAWIANPSASAATTSVAGIVELATTAETTTGTDPTRAVTPDGLHDMTSLAGAAWFLDEDDMTSDSATKTVSQQSVKAYVISQGGLFGGVGSAGTKTYNNFHIPWIVSTDVPSGNFWTVTNSSNTYHWGYAQLNASGDLNHSVITTNSLATRISGGGSTTLDFGNSKDFICEFTMQRNAVGTEQMGWGFSSTTAPFFAYNDTSADAACFTVSAAGQIYAHTSNGAASTETSLSGVTLTDNNTYRIELNDGTDAKFYVNGTLKATVTTTLPNSGAVKFGVGCQGNTSDNDRAVIGPVWFAVEK